MFAQDAFKDHRIAITGVTGGIGKATAKAFAKLGGQIFGSDKDDLDDTAIEALPGTYAPVDVTDEAALDAWFSGIAAETGQPPSITVVNAGIVLEGSALEINRADWESVLQVNLTGAWLTARTAARHLIEAKQPGAIVVVGSWAGHAAHPKSAAYSTSKAGLRMMVQCLAQETAPHSIRVNEAAPGWVDAGMSGRRFDERGGEEARKIARAKVPNRSLMTAEDVARQILWLAHPDNTQLIGETLVADGGLSIVRRP
ncbi:MAG: SDR family NAD(P)-dependent oxidoreductase [Opitutales bacterium]